MKNYSTMPDRYEEEDNGETDEDFATVDGDYQLDGGDREDGE